MKKLLPAVLLCFLFYGCSHFEKPEQKAQRLIKLYLDSSLNDPKSYQSVKFGKLDTMKSIYMDDPKYIEFHDKYREYMLAENKEMDKVSSTYSLSELNLIKKKTSLLFDSAKMMVDKESAIEKTFKPATIGWMMLHSYRGKNSFGALILSQTEFYFDKKLTKVDSTSTLKN